MNYEDHNVNHEVGGGERPAGGIVTERGRRFLAPGGGGNDRGYRGRPGRELELDVVADGVTFTEQPSQEQIAAIRAATRMIDEPEAPSRAWVDAKAELAARYEQQRHTRAVMAARAIRADLSWSARIDDVERRARQRKVNLGHGVQDARRALARLERGGRRASPSFRRLVEGMEARLDGPVAGEQQAA